ncbi:MAG: hypothetical protein HOO96_28095 [Polyangiaceae bacterium]|nr:hypothetical protein [Polyangiaceae bacterium]
MRALWADLERAGMPELRASEDINDLRAYRKFYENEAVAILARHLPAIPGVVPGVPGNAKLGVILALSSPLAAEAVPALLSEFERDATSLRGQLGIAIASGCGDQHFDAIVRLLRDQRFTIGRAGLVHGLHRMKRRRDEAHAVMVELLGDSIVGPYALAELATRKRDVSRAPRAQVEAFLAHPLPWVRKAATKIIAAIEGAAPRALKYGRTCEPDDIGDGAAGLAETSAGLDASAGPRLLRHVAALVRFEAAALKELRSVLKNLDAGDAYEFDLMVAYEGAHAPLKLWLFSKDGDDLELRAYSVPSLILAIDAVLAKVMESSGS